MVDDVASQYTRGFLIQWAEETTYLPLQCFHTFDVNNEGPLNYIFRNLWSLSVELFLSTIPKMSSKCKSQLTLEQRYALVQDSDSGKSQRKLAEKYEISVGAVNKNLKRKRDITDAHDLNLNPKTKQMRPNCKFEDINEKIFAWFQGARARNIPISGPVIQAKALEIAKSFGNAEFKGQTDGWRLSLIATRSVSVFCPERVPEWTWMPSIAGVVLWTILCKITTWMISTTVMKLGSCSELCQQSLMWRRVTPLMVPKVPKNVSLFALQQHVWD